MYKRLLPLLLTLPFLAGCSVPAVKGEAFLKEVPVNDGREAPVIPEGVRHAMFRLTEELTPDYFQASTKKNQIFSPLSLWYALGVLREGASGETLAELDRLMKVEEGFASREVIPPLSKALNFMIPARSVKNSKTGIRLSNGIFLEERYRANILDQYLADAADIWGTETAAVDFRKEAQTKEIIRDWVSRKTDAFIPDYEASFSSEGSHLLNIYNVLYLKDQWLVPFQKLGSQAFQAPTGSVQVPFMGGQSQASAWFEDGSVQAAAFSGETGLRVWFLLPQAGTDPLTLIPRLEEILASQDTAQVLLKAPLLEFDGDNVSLRDLLMAKGYGRLFQGAELDRIVSGTGLAVGDIKQKTKLKIDENGFEAAAITEIGLAGAMPSKPVALTLDRPYLLVIEYEGLPLFVSQITDPS